MKGVYYICWNVPSYTKFPVLQKKHGGLRQITGSILPDLYVGEFALSLSQVLVQFYTCKKTKDE